MDAEQLDARIRAAMFAYLDQISAREGVPSSRINAFEFDGTPIRLIVQPGIRKPAFLDAALTIRTTFTPDGAVSPYEDGFGPDNLLRYKWRGTDANQADNRALREAWRRQAPLAYFVGLAPGVYQAIYPVVLTDEDPLRHEFTVDFSHRAGVEVYDSPVERRYAERLTRHRLHQIVFRPRVLSAYDKACAMCRLRYANLLDAAHILPDGHERGDPVVPNGLALCKIHHAAYDANIIGIRPDHVVEVRTDVLTAVDGPMLRHGLQDTHGTRIFVPKVRTDRPDRDRLEERYEQFRAA
jgi:putative restriction endonuclease